MRDIPRSTRGSGRGDRDRIAGKGLSRDGVADGTTDGTGHQRDHRGTDENTGDGTGRARSLLRCRR